MKNLFEAPRPLTDEDFTDPSVFGESELAEWLDDNAADYVDEGSVIDFVEAQQGQGSVGDNFGINFDEEEPMLFDGSQVLFSMLLTDYYRDRHDEKCESEYSAPCSLRVPLVKGKIDSRRLSEQNDSYDVSVLGE